MRTHPTVGLAVLLACSVSGCGSAGPQPEDIYKGIISVVKQAASAMQEIKDESSAESALAKLEKIAERHDELSRKMRAPTVSADEREKLIDRYWKQEGEAVDELTRAAATAKKRAPRHAERIDALLGKLGIHQTTLQGPSKK
jgi:SOS response regulatory protein OraA/RecX